MKVRVDEEDGPAERRERQRELPRRLAHGQNEHAQCCRDEHLAVERPRLAEERERAAVPGRERGAHDRRDEDRKAGPRAAEERDAGLVRDREPDRGKGARLVQHDLRRVDAGEFGDEREEPVPERERVPRMQPAVDELVDRADVQRPECVELPHAPEVEQRVPVDDAGDAPERDPEEETRRRDRDRVPGRRTIDHAPGERRGGQGDRGEHDERDPDARVRDEDDDEREGQRGQRPGDGGCRASHAQRSRDERAGHEEHERRGNQPQPQSEAFLG